MGLGRDESVPSSRKRRTGEAARGPALHQSTLSFSFSPGLDKKRCKDDGMQNTAEAQHSDLACSMVS
jgi:hypothetical protein